MTRTSSLVTSVTCVQAREELRMADLDGIVGGAPTALGTQQVAGGKNPGLPVVIAIIAILIG